MAYFTYTARAAIAPGHFVGETYTIELDLVEEQLSTSDSKEQPRSAGGAIETIFFRTDRFYSLQFAPVRGEKLKLLREFLASIEAGHVFRARLYGDESQELALRFIDENYSESWYMPNGSEESDYWDCSIRVIAARTFDPDTFSEEEDSGDPFDPYDPNFGGDPTGGLDEPGAAPGAPGMIAVAHNSSPYITIYNLSDLSKIPNPTTLPTSNGRAVRFSPDGSLLAVAQNSGAPLVYDTSDWSAFQLSGSNAWEVEWSPDGSLLFAESGDVYDTSDWSYFSLGISAIRGVAFSPDASKVAIASSSGAVILDTTTWSTLETLTTEWCTDIDWSPDGNYVAVSLLSTLSNPFVFLMVFRTSDWTTVSLLTEPGYTCYSPRFSPDGSTLAVYYHTFGILYYSTSSWLAGTPVVNPTGADAELCYSKDGSRLYVAHRGTNYLIFYDTSDWSTLQLPEELPPDWANSIDVYEP